MVHVSPNSYGEIPVPSVVLLWGKALRGTSSWGIRDSRDLCCLFHHVRTIKKTKRTRRQTPARHQFCCDLGLLAFRIVFQKHHYSWGYGFSSHAERDSHSALRRGQLFKLTKLLLGKSSAWLGLYKFKWWHDVKSIIVDFQISHPLKTFLYYSNKRIPQVLYRWVLIYSG